MAIFRVPRITTTQRERLVLLESEVVFDLDLKKYFGGDGSSRGGFLIGSNLGFRVERIVVTDEHIQNKRIILTGTPFNPNSVSLTFEKGIPQVNGIDFIVQGNVLSWNGKGLDGFIDNTDVLLVQY
jgi:hypothetical protein